MERLSELTGISRKTLRIHTKSLINKGFLAVDERYTEDGGRTSNAYDLAGLFDALERVMAEDPGETEPRTVAGNIAPGCTPGSNRTGGLVQNVPGGVVHNVPGGVPRVTGDGTPCIQGPGTPCNQGAGTPGFHELDKEQVDQGQVDKDQKTSRDAPTGPPTTRDLIAELTDRLHSIEGVERLHGNYPLIGKAVKQYGYEAVLQAIEDLEFEADGRRQLNRPVWTNGELRRVLFARCKWNHKPPKYRPGIEEGHKPKTSPNLDDLFKVDGGKLVAYYGGIPKGVKVVGTTIYALPEKGGDRIVDAS